MTDNKEESLVVGRPEKPSVPPVQNKDGELKTTSGGTSSQPRKGTPMSVP